MAEERGDKPERSGHAGVEYRPTRSILTRASGFMRDYDFTLNPYAGCSFGCTYCYAAFFAKTTDKRDAWGYWVEVKEDALEVLRRMRTPLRDKTIYMSSVTDPYQPVERKLGLVRSLLQELVKHQPRLVVQTRSQLAVRDVDLYRQFDHVRVNMTVTTDSERVRRAFEPHCSTNRKRLEAVAAIQAAGVDSAITMTPLLPVDDAEAFADSLVRTGVTRFVVQPFHAERGRFVAGTREAAVALVRELGWTPHRYQETVDVLRRRLPSLHEGREGFAPT
jgi:DNA repair photolyase